MPDTLGVVAPANAAANTMADVGANESDVPFLTKVKNELANLLEVKVVTIVGDVKVELGASDDGKTTTTKVGGTTVDTGSIVTIYKMLDGDVTRVIPASLKGDAALLAMHEAQVATSLRVLPDHLKALVDLAERLELIPPST